MFEFREFIPDDHVPYLTHLIALSFSTRQRLEVENLDDAFSREDVMIASHAFAKPECEQKVLQSRESDVVVGVTGKDLIEKLVVPRHSRTIPETAMGWFPDESPASQYQKSRGCGK
jgi:hypothetical protein